MRVDVARGDQRNKGVRASASVFFFFFFRVSALSSQARTQSIAPPRASPAPLLRRPPRRARPAWLPRRTRAPRSPPSRPLAARGSHTHTHASAECDPHCARALSPSLLPEAPRTAARAPPHPHQTSPWNASRRPCPARAMTPSSSRRTARSGRSLVRGGEWGRGEARGGAGAVLSKGQGWGPARGRPHACTLRTHTRMFSLYVPEPGGRAGDEAVRWLGRGAVTGGGEVVEKCRGEKTGRFCLLRLTRRLASASRAPPPPHPYPPPHPPPTGRTVEHVRPASGPGRAASGADRAARVA